MKFSKKTAILGAFGLILIIGSATGISLYFYQRFYQRNNQLTVTFIDRAGILLEHNNNRIYIDPYRLPDSYSEKPADAIFITHSHADHLSKANINKIYTSTTTIICPTSATSILTEYNSVGVQPMEEGICFEIPFQAFPMYTNSTIHPKNENWTGYILNFKDFTLFHAGDSDFIPEYAQLEGKIDILLVPIYDSYNMMGPAEVNKTITLIKPRYVIPIHYLDVGLEIFQTSYAPSLTFTTFLYLQPGESYTFNLAKEI